MIKPFTTSLVLMALAFCQPSLPIKRGEATMTGPPINPAELKKVVIKAVTPFYWAGIGYNPQERVYPFAVLEVDAHLGNSTVSLELNCPILMEQ